MSNQREEEILRRRERIKKSKERRRRNQSRNTGEKKADRSLQHIRLKVSQPNKAARQYSFEESEH